MDIQDALTDKATIKVNLNCIRERFKGYRCKWSLQN